MAKNSDPRRGDVLLSRFSALGDVAMTIPPVYDLCASNPDRRFVFLTRKHPATIFINRPPNLIVHAVDTDRYRGIAGMRRLYKELTSAYDIGVYVDLHDVIRTRLLRLFFRLAGRTVTHVDKGRAARRRLTRANAKHLVPLRPMALRYADAMRAAGLKLERRFRSIFATPPAPEAFAAATPPKRPGERWIAIAPFARHAGKIYPADLMEQVVDALAAEPDTRIFIFGFGDEESRLIEGWRKGRANIVDMAALRIGIPAEIALLAHCDVMLTMDSANMHLAALCGLRTVSIWGATHPYCGFRPESLRDEDIVQLNMTCRPCSVFGQRPCRRGDLHCLRGITPARVLWVLNKTPLR